MTKHRVTFKLWQTIKKVYTVEVEADSIYEASCIAEEMEIPDVDSDLWVTVGHDPQYDEDYEVEEIDE